MNFVIFEIQYTKNYKIRKSKIEKFQYFENSKFKNFYVLGIENFGFLKFLSNWKIFMQKIRIIF